MHVKACEYNHSGDDGKEDPPVPIPNTEVKLFYAESTCRVTTGRIGNRRFPNEAHSFRVSFFFFLV